MKLHLTVHGAHKKKSGDEMTHDKLLAKIADDFNSKIKVLDALYAVVELHKPWNFGCSHCIDIEGGYKSYPCPTIQSIEKELA